MFPSLPDSPFFWKLTPCMFGSVVMRPSCVCVCVWESGPPVSLWLCLSLSLLSPSFPCLV